ncbi:MAG: ABC transporter substrate-binding protein [Parasporobacterium sp.]|nr:ABC transporter substrate-binding protein [Parasporobacterium sp.]MBQ9032987.1 ABC transporter substrate-binding protein [Parasporobacterium sp.]
MKKVLAIVIAVMMLSSLMAGFAFAAEDGAEGGAVAVTEWEIPVLSAITGPVSFVGEPAIWAANYAAEKINEAGGIEGVPVKIVPYDTEFDPQKGMQYITQLQDTALFIGGCVAAPVCEAEAQVLYEEHIPNIGSYVSSALDEYAPYICAYMGDSEILDLELCKEWMAAKGYEKLVMFYSPDDTAQAATVDRFAQEVPEYLGAVEVPTGTIDCGPLAVQAMNMGADAFWLGCRTEEASKVCKELVERGAVESGEQICATFSAMGAGFLEIAGETAEGTYAYNMLDVNCPDETWQELSEAYKADHNGDAPTYPPIQGFYNMIVALKACFEDLGITGDPAVLQEEREAIAEWLNNSPEIEGCQGTFSWVNGVMQIEAPVVQVQDGNYVVVTME